MPERLVISNASPLINLAIIGQLDLLKQFFSATNISLLENERIEIGKRRAEQLAKAFDIHPAIIMFPDYESEEIKNAA